MASPDNLEAFIGWAARRAATSLTRYIRHAGDDDATLHRLLERLSNERELRFFVDGTRNMGHQASTASLIKRLIDLLDYQYDIVVVYLEPTDRRLGSTRAKLALLWPGLDGSAIDDVTVAYGACHQIRFLDYTDRHSLRCVATFGFSGGADNMSTNYARALNVRWFVRLQPYLWDDPSSHKADPYYQSSRIETLDERAFYFADGCDTFRSLRLAGRRPRPLTSAARKVLWRWYAQQSSDFELGARLRTLWPIIEAHCVDHRIALWPVYGLQHFGDSAPDILCNCTRLALLDAAARDRPLLILCLSPPERTPAPDRLVDLMAVASNRDGRPWLDVASAYDDTTGRYADVSDRIHRFLSMAEAGDVLVVRIGSVPAPVFEYLLQTADLPSVIEGQHSASLALAAGKAFFQIPRPDHVITNGYPATAGGRDFDALPIYLNAAAKALASRPCNGWAEDDDAASKRLARPRTVIRAASVAGSRIGRYFRALGEDGDAAHPDKLVAALITLAHLVDSGVPAGQGPPTATRLARTP